MLGSFFAPILPPNSFFVDKSPLSLEVDECFFTVSYLTCTVCVESLDSSESKFKM